MNRLTIKTLLAVAAIALSATAIAQPGYYYDDRPEPGPGRYERGPGRYERPSHFEETFRRHDVYFGLRVGFNASVVRSGAEELNGTGVKCGLNVGAVVGVQLLPETPVYVETGMFYSAKGGKSSNTLNQKFTYDLNYLEFPIVFKYNYYIRDDIAIIPQLGGFLACGVSGKIKDYKDRKAFSSYEDGYFRRFDAGLRLGCGAEFKMFYADMSYDFGLANIGRDSFNDTHTGAFTMTVGVNF